MNINFSPKDIYEAIRVGDIKQIKQIFNANIELLNLKTPLGSWLHIATQHGQTQIVEYLVNMGVDVNVQGGSSNSNSLNVAAQEGNVELLEYFLKKGAVIDVSEPDRNPLFSAIHNGHINAVELLIEAGVDTSVKYTGQTMINMDAIEFAKEWGRIDIAELINKKKH